MQPDPAAESFRVFFYVQHLLGVGHLHRAARIAKALAKAAFKVHLVLGGEPSPGLDVGGAEIIRLPPVKAGAGGFSSLVHPDGRPFAREDEGHRARLLLDAFDRFAPDVLMTEAFPFGRRQMRFELLPLLEHARRRGRPPLIVASVRDIVQRDSRPERAAETVALVERFYDAVLVHGDPSFVRLEDSFKAAHAFADKLVYTGVVAPEVAARRPGEHYGAVVSVGGGAVGQSLLETAIRAKPLTRIGDRPWLLLTGPNLPAATRTLLGAHEGGRFRIKSFVPDLADVLGRAEVSVSQAGYNTVADILVSRCRAVLIPFASGGETEQSDRADRLARLGMATAIAEDGMTAEGLAAAIDRALDRPPPGPVIDLAGAPATARWLRDKLTRAG